MALPLLPEQAPAYSTVAQRHRGPGGNVDTEDTEDDGGDGHDGRDEYDGYDEYDG
ncbi:MAG: hypothetical protein WBG36_14985 [Ornithinimicrobium sp.]